MVQIGKPVLCGGSIAQNCFAISLYDATKTVTFAQVVKKRTAVPSLVLTSTLLSSAIFLVLEALCNGCVNPCSNFFLRCQMAPM